MQLLFTGDFLITNGHDRSVGISEELQVLFDDSEYTIANLEGPIVQKEIGNILVKTGPNLCGHINNLSMLKQLGVNLVSLSNNHIMDYGQPGLIETQRMLNKYKIDFLGAGESLKDAMTPFSVLIDAHKVTFLNFSENEWCSAAEKRAGANPLNIINNIKQIQKEKKECDILIVIIHGGHEYYNLPSPRMVQQYRFYAENGASLIVGHHPHCASGFEYHKGVPIFYSLGNFLFTKQSHYSSWYLGLLLGVEIGDDLKLNCSYFPVKQSKKDFFLKLLSNENKGDFIEELKEINETISDKDKLDEAWHNFIKEKKEQYLNVYSPLNLIPHQFMRRVLKKLGANAIFMNKSHYKRILNGIRCEAHLDASKAIIEMYLQEDRNKNFSE